VRDGPRYSNFTTFLRGTPADEVVSTYNALELHGVAPSTSTNGIVNKFLGDGFLAIFRRALTPDKTAPTAVPASRRILDEVEQLVARARCRPRRSASRSMPRRDRGSIGFRDRKDDTVIGDVGECRLRIEG